METRPSQPPFPESPPVRIPYNNEQSPGEEEAMEYYGYTPSSLHDPMRSS